MRSLTEIWTCVKCHRVIKYPEPYLITKMGLVVAHKSCVKE